MWVFGFYYVLSVFSHASPLVLGLEGRYIRIAALGGGCGEFPLLSRAHVHPHTRVVNLDYLSEIGVLERQDDSVLGVHYEAFPWYAEEITMMTSILFKTLQEFDRRQCRRWKICNRSIRLGVTVRCPEEHPCSLVLP
jgi:hypothetical protein